VSSFRICCSFRFECLELCIGDVPLSSVCLWLRQLAFIVTLFCSSIELSLPFLFVLVTSTSFYCGLLFSSGLFSPALLVEHWFCKCRPAMLYIFVIVQHGAAGGGLEVRGLHCLLNKSQRDAGQGFRSFLFFRFGGAGLDGRMVSRPTSSAVQTESLVPYLGATKAGKLEWKCI
jgi:hypothetical protein